MAKTIDTTEFQDNIPNPSVTLPASEKIDREAIADDFASQIEVIDKCDMSILEQAKFMEEPVEVRILDTENQFAEQTIMLEHQGVVQYLIRGMITKIKRKFLYVLATSRLEIPRTVEITDPSGSKTTRIEKGHTHRYQYELVNDHRNGRLWHEKILHDPQI